MRCRKQAASCALRSLRVEANAESRRWSVLCSARGDNLLARKLEKVSLTSTHTMHEICGAR